MTCPFYKVMRLFRGAEKNWLPSWEAVTKKRTLAGKDKSIFGKQEKSDRFYLTVTFCSGWASWHLLQCCSVNRESNHCPWPLTITASVLRGIILLKNNVPPRKSSKTKMHILANRNRLNVCYLLSVFHLTENWQKWARGKGQECQLCAGGCIICRPNAPGIKVTEAFLFAALSKNNLSSV